MRERKLGRGDITGIEFKSVVCGTKTNWRFEAEQLAAGGDPFVLVEFDFAKDGAFFRALPERWGLKARSEPNRRRAYFWKAG